MTEKEAIYILRNAAWLGSNEERQKVEEAVEVVAKAIEALNNSEIPNSFGKDTNVPSNDTISRQAAIDALDEYFERIGNLKRRGLNKGEKAISLDTVGAIKSLPSAQPEIIRCKDCKHRDKYGCCKYWKGLAMGDIPIATDDYDFCSYAKRI